MEILVVRHGQTDWNLKNKIQGTTDIPLNANGIAQANLTRTLLEKENIDIIISSPLIRALKTASIVNANRNIPIFIDARISEINFGVLEGQEKGSPAFKSLLTYNSDNEIEGAISLKRLALRVYNFLDNLSNKYPPNYTILLSTHGVISAVIDTYFNKLPEDGYIYPLIPNNCEIRRYSLLGLYQ